VINGDVSISPSGFERSNGVLFREIGASLDDRVFVVGFVILLSLVVSF
jgi:hypothetical protein